MAVICWLSSALFPLSLPLVFLSSGTAVVNSLVTVSVPSAFFVTLVALLPDTVAVTLSANL